MIELYDVKLLDQAVTNDLRAFGLSACRRRLPRSGKMGPRPSSWPAGVLPEGEGGAAAPPSSTCFAASLQCTTQALLSQVAKAHAYGRHPQQIPHLIHGNTNRQHTPMTMQAFKAQYSCRACMHKCMHAQIGCGVELLQGSGIIQQKLCDLSRTVSEGLYLLQCLQGSSQLPAQLQYAVPSPLCWRCLL